MWKMLLSLSAAAFFAGVAFAGDVHVRGYFRKDGTYVAPHVRSAPAHPTATASTTTADPLHAIGHSAFRPGVATRTATVSQTASISTTTTTAPSTTTSEGGYHA